MIAFEIAIEDRRMCTAGVAGEGVTSVIATWVRRPSHDPVTEEPLPGHFEEELTLDVGGLTHDPDGSPVHLQWLRHPLKVGQRITLTVVETAEADPPQTRNREDPAVAAHQKRRYYERLKRELGE